LALELAFRGRREGAFPMSQLGFMCRQVHFIKIRRPAVFDISLRLAFPGRCEDGFLQRQLGLWCRHVIFIKIRGAAVLDFPLS